jgi:hypothetical protein
MNLYERLYPDVAIQVPDCPDPTISRAILYALRTVLLATQVWRPVLDRFITFDGVNEYPIELPANTRIAKVFRVQVDGRDISSMDRHALVLQGADAGYYIDEAHNFLVSENTPRGWVTLDCALFPTATDVNIDLPEHLAHDYEDMFTAAALGRLFMMENVPWSNPNKAIHLQSLLGAYIDSARALSSNRNAPRRRAVKYGGY